MHEKTPHAEIESSLNPMDSLQGYLLPEVWFVPSWESIEASVLDSYLDVGFISSGILMYILLNLLEKSETDSPSFLFRDPNSVM